MGNGVAEREINLFDLLWAVCLKWRSILASAIIFTLLAGGFSYMRSAAAVSAAMEEVDLTEVEAELTADEKSGIGIYLEYDQLRKDQLAYNTNAPLMLLDANAFYKGEVTYYIDNHYKVEYPVIEETNNIVAIVNMYKAELKRDSFIQDVNVAVGVDADSVYATELIDCDNLYSNKNSIASNPGNGIMTVAVYAKDKETCDKLKELVKARIADSQAFVQRQLGAHDVTIVQDACAFSSDTDILTYQKTNIDRLQAYVKTMTDLKAKFSEGQSAYVEGYVNNEALQNTEAVEEVAAPEISKKLVVLGFIGGAFLMFVIWALLYIFSSRIRLEDDFEQIFQSKLLGNVPMAGQGKKKWFGFIDRIFINLRHLNQRYFEKDEALDMIAANIRIAMQKADVKKVMVTGAVCGDDEKKVAEELAMRLKKDSIEIICESPVLYNAEVLEKLVEIGYVVLVEKAEKSLYQEVEKEIEICKQQEAQLVGCVVVY